MRHAFVFVTAAALVALGAGTLPAQDLKTVAVQDGGSIKGTVKISGSVPKQKKIKMDADPKCAALHAEAPLNEEVVADAEGNVKWAFVYLKKGPSTEKEHKAPGSSVTINQKGCKYEPHVFGVVTGQPIDIINSDDLLHNIHALPFNNKEFNFGQPTKGQKDTKQFDKEEVMVKIKCDVHPWMSAWAGVLKHPFFSVSGDKGDFEIKGVAPGKYTIEVWHEKYKSVTQEIEVKVGDNKVDFALAEKKE